MDIGTTSTLKDVNKNTQREFSKTWQRNSYCTQKGATISDKLDPAGGVAEVS